VYCNGMQQFLTAIGRYFFFSFSFSHLFFQEIIERKGKWQLWI
jgi:hypothetical protein